MRTPTIRGSQAPRLIALSCVILLSLSGALWWTSTLQSGNRVTAYFAAAVGLYPGTEVRVLGMPVGSVSQVAPQGPVVRVDMLVDEEVPVPADAGAVAVTPNLVSDRYIQLTPVYSSGPKMADGAQIPRDRTATPVELDELHRNVDKLNTALGPEGANKHGALTDLLNTSAANLAGNGDEINRTLTQLGQAASTLSDSRGDLFSTVDNMQKFTGALAASDTQVHQLNGQLADASRFLASEREELAATLHELPAALEEVRGFVESNRGGLKSNVEHLDAVTRTLVDQRSALAEVLDVAPLGLSNLIRTYDPESGTLRTRINPNELSHPPILTVCKLIRQSQPQDLPPVLADACGKLAPVLDGALPLPAPAEAIASLHHGTPPPLPLPLAGALSGTTPGGGQ